MASRTYSVVAPTDPALPPPPGVIPDFQDPFSLRPYHNVAASLAISFSGFFLILRLYTKARIIRHFNLEDYFCTFAFAFYCVWTAMEFKVINAGSGTHQWNMTVRELSEQYRFTNYTDIIYSPTVCFTKISIILLVLRIFCPQMRDPCYWVLQALNVLNTAFYVVFFFIPIFSCQPRQKIFDKSSPGTCLNVFVLYIFSGTFNTLSDIAMFFVPLWRIWHLSISQSRKIGISAIFFSGGLAIISSIFRLVACVQLLLNADYSYVKAQTAIWTHSEISFGLICSCLFVLPRLYRHLAAIPPYGSEEYNEYQRRKSWATKPLDASHSKLHKETEMDLGDIETGIEAPSVPPTWGSESHESVRKESWADVQSALHQENVRRGANWYRFHNFGNPSTSEQEVRMPARQGGDERSHGPKERLPPAP